LSERLELAHQSGSADKGEDQASQTLNVNHPQERKERYERAMRQPQSPSHKRTIPPPRDNNPGMSFIEITQSQIVSPPPDPASKPFDNKHKTSDENDAPLSWQLERHERLFAILSAHSDIDHPICTECSSMLLTSLNTKLATATRERDAYASFLKQLQQAAAKNKGDEEKVDKELAALQKEEETAFAELLQLEEQKKQLENEVADLEEEDKQLEKDEQLFWLSRNTFDEKQHELETELASLQQKYAHDQKQFERLQRTNVYNDTFYISHDGTYGTINGLRLGRLQNGEVQWPEINAAWGQTLLLLQTLAERLSFSFQGYRLRPLGSTSRIEKFEYPQRSPNATRDPQSRANAAAPAKTTILELYSSGGAMERLIHSRRFDQGMEAFLDCLNQLGKHVERSSTTAVDAIRPSLSRTPSAATNTSAAQPLRLPYAIEGDKIWNRDGSPDNAASIRLGVGFAPDENFTKACKYVLTCCKYLLAHVSNLDGSKPGQA